MKVPAFVHKGPLADGASSPAPRARRLPLAFFALFLLLLGCLTPAAFAQTHPKTVGVDEGDAMPWEGAFPSASGTISSVNGNKLTRIPLCGWTVRGGMHLEFSRPGKPTDNPFIASFNGKLRTECLEQNLFASLTEAKAILEVHRKEYNTERPHTALGYQTPEQHRQNGQTKQEQTKV